MQESIVSSFSVFNQELRGHVRNIETGNNASNILTDYASSPASDFLNGKEQNVRELELHAFDNFIKSRIQYLTTLTYLGADWISEKSEPPQIQIIDAAKSLLRSIYNWFSSEEGRVLFTPDIIMGPIPSGGISFEIKTNQATIYLSLLNDGSYTLEVSQDGFYYEWDNTDNNYLDGIIKLLSFYGIRRDHSGWGNFI